jgi:hypothetical protein
MGPALSRCAREGRTYDNDDSDNEDHHRRHHYHHHHHRCSKHGIETPRPGIAERTRVLTHRYVWSAFILLFFFGGWFSRC